MIKKSSNLIGQEYILVYDQNQPGTNQNPPGTDQNCIILVDPWWVPCGFLKKKLEWFDWHWLYSWRFIKRQGVSQKIKTADVFSKLWNQTGVYQRSPPWLATRMPEILSWERNISEYDIMQHTQITTEKLFSLFIIKLVEIRNRNT